MKLSIRALNVVLTSMALCLLVSCENRMNDESGKGDAEFSLSIPDEITKSVSGLSQDSGVVSYHLMVTIEDMEGNVVLSDSLIPVYAFGNAFTSENVKLETGEFKLTKFLVINPSGEVMYASPVEGSPLAYLVTDPLPLIFKINPEQVTRVTPEVLAVGDQSPAQFGYAGFGIQIIKPLGFWAVCMIDCPMCMSPTQLTTAKLTVYSGNGWHYTFRLEAGLNHLIVRGGSDVYKFLLEKEGHASQTLMFTAEQLRATTKENPLVLKIPLENQWNSLVLQPGPDNGKDAMVTNLEPDKNFGGYKYFEATFLSEPVLTVMRSNRSIIWFDRNALPKSAIIKKVTLQLTYDLPVPFDSTFVTGTDPATGVVRYGGVLQQIVEPWEESKVTWNTQPKTIEANQVYISPFIRNVNFIIVDVTSLFVPVQEVAAANYGMLFKLWPTEKFPGFRFASSDYPEPTMRPKLTIYYTMK
ncbi:MAG: DNRLRE domain-containing protein [Bacteroidales bacterium]